MIIDLLASAEMGSNPKKFYTVAKVTALLAGMAYRTNIDWDDLGASGYRYIV